MDDLRQIASAEVEADEASLRACKAHMEAEQQAGRIPPLSVEQIVIYERAFAAGWEPAPGLLPPLFAGKITDDERAEAGKILSRYHAHAHLSTIGRA